LKHSGGHSAQGVFGLAIAYEQLGLTDVATAEYKEYARLDPFSYVAWAGIARTDFEQAHYQDAIDSSKPALALHPDDPVTREYVCASQASLGRITEAKATLDFLSQPGIPKPIAFHCQFFIMLHSRGAKAAIAFVNAGLAGGPKDTGGPGDVGFMLSHAPGAFDQAMDSYEKAFNPSDWGFNFYPGQSPPPAFFQNSRWIALTKRPEYVKWTAARERARSELTN
jgi:tetratricopeptide (TPR) repeat protein